MDVAPVVDQWLEVPPMEVKYTGAEENFPERVSTSRNIPLAEYTCQAVRPCGVCPDAILCVVMIFSLIVMKIVF